MPKATNIKMVAVYVTEEQKRKLEKAAALQHRSLSNYLLVNGLEKAEELGVGARVVEKKRASR
jgi:uncharacterized protein (DUF1778 family)